MTISTRKTVLTGLAMFGSVAMLAACAQAPATTDDTNSAAASDFVPCMVSDAGGFDDKSFNQLGFEGLNEAAKSLGVTPITVESATETDYQSNVQNLVDQGCSLIVTVGFNLAAATVESALANPEVNYAIIDDTADLDFNGEVDAPNIKPIVFDTAPAGFMAGYAAAGYSKTGVVGTYGGLQIPPVTIFMDGFADGVTYFNDQNGTSVQTVGWDVASQTGSFTGGFAAGVDSLAKAQGLIDQNADVLLPVGGPIFLSAIEAIKSSGKDIAMIGVDADLYETYPDGADLFLTSILKGIKVGVSDVVTGAGTGAFDATAFVGTLANDGVGVAPFHDFESKVPATMTDELDAIKAGIIDGSITVESPASPKQ
ncbi:basic membrane protein A [Cryobacterium flavum]|uniref:BMP family ABC transporter substrate-binding protein n=1 Tax=Cryobacterium flavum TaxID=1424659 RepID=A0A4R8VF42_9MICO|nr:MULTISPECIES: BMP family ABC transporter substrate-binding protein [Cryobacterium]TFB81166.1 BMP family ABC transporter substrate-binding protein [Cryobacterium flavum]SDM72568.1 basic membrane protein A [Cryobacterium flavum]